MSLLNSVRPAMALWLHHACCALVGRRPCRRFEQRIGNAAPGEDVEASPVEILRILGHFPKSSGVEICRHWRKHAGAAHFVVKLPEATSSESRISSASRRLRGNTASSLFSGSALCASSRYADDWR